MYVYHQLLIAVVVASLARYVRAGGATPTSTERKPFRWFCQRKTNYNLQRYHQHRHFVRVVVDCCGKHCRFVCIVSCVHCRVVNGVLSKFRSFRGTSKVRPRTLDLGSSNFQLPRFFVGSRTFEASRKTSDASWCIERPFRPSNPTSKLETRTSNFNLHKPSGFQSLVLAPLVIDESRKPLFLRNKTPKKTCPRQYYLFRILIIYQSELCLVG